MLHGCGFRLQLRDECDSVRTGIFAFVKLRFTQRCWLATGLYAPCQGRRVNGKRRVCARTSCSLLHRPRSTASRLARARFIPYRRALNTRSQKTRRTMMNLRLRPGLLTVLLVFGCLNFAPTLLIAQDPGDCGVNRDDGSCVKPNGSGCTTANHRAGHCKTVTTSQKNMCVCEPGQPPPPPKKGGGTYDSLAVFLALMTGWLGFRGGQWLRRAQS